MIVTRGNKEHCGKGRLQLWESAVTLTTCLRALSGLLQNICSRLQSCSGVEYRYSAAGEDEEPSCDQWG